MKVVIDARMLGPAMHGMARYVSLLARGLSEMKLAYEPVFIVNPRGQSPGAISNRLGGLSWIQAESGFLHPKELLEIPKLLKREAAHLYHSPSFSSLLSVGPLRPICPWVLTVHDLCHLQYASWKEKAYYRLLLKPFARRASALLTVSEFSRQEIEGWTGRRDIEVVFNGLDPALLLIPDSAEINRVASKYGLTPGRYFICPSNPKPHKNVLLLRGAYQSFAAEARSAGKQPWPLVLTLKEDPREAGVFCTGALPESELRPLLAGAGALAFPSLYEGFGLPPLEAAVIGIPLIVSEIPPHREAVRDLASDEVLWADPRSENAWAKALAQAQAGAIRRPSEESRAKLAERYAYRHLAEHMDRIYRRVLKLSP